MDDQCHLENYYKTNLSQSYVFQSSMIIIFGTHNMLNILKKKNASDFKRRFQMSIIFYTHNTPNIVEKCFRFQTKISDEPQLRLVLESQPNPIGIRIDSSLIAVPGLPQNPPIAVHSTKSPRRAKWPIHRKRREKKKKKKWRRRKMDWEGSRSGWRNTLRFTKQPPDTLSSKASETAPLTSLPSGVGWYYPLYSSSVFFFTRPLCFSFLFLNLMKRVLKLDSIISTNGN